MPATRDDKLAAIDSNLPPFLTALPGLLAEHRGEYALLRRGEVVAFYKAPLDAQIAGNTRFEDELFSIQKVTDVPEHLGFQAYAVDPRRS